MATDNSPHPPRSPSGKTSTSIATLELEIKNLKRDNQALQAQLNKVKEAQNKKGKSLEQEKEMRLQANQDRYWLRQKLSRMQMVINARLKMLGIDFDNCDDLASALDAAFNAIQKLSVELQKKEEEVGEWEKKYGVLQAELDKLRGTMEKKEQNMAKLKDTLESQKMALAEKDKRISQFGKDTDRLNVESEQHEKELATLRQQMENEKEKSQKQFDKFMEQKQKWEEEMKKKDQEIEDLEGSLKKELYAKDEEVKKTLKELEAMSKLYQESQQKNEDLQREIDELKSRMRDLEDTMAIQDEEISGYKNDAEKNQDLNLELEKRLSQQTNTMSDKLKDLQTEKAQMLQAMKMAKEQIGMKDEELKRLKQILDQVKRDLEKSKKDHEDYMNRPREDKAVQTDIGSRWFDDTALKLTDLDRLRTENNQLASDLAFADGKIRGLTEENKVLVDEIDYLIKQAAKFKADSANHTGGVIALAAAPNSYMFASSATDKSVRLWKVNIEADGKEEKVCQVYASSHLERQAPALAFSKDGTYLAGGVGQRDNPNGSILVWNMAKGEGEVEIMFRSRPTVRFGGVHCLCFSDNNRYIFAGDTTGTVWVWDMQYGLQLVEVHMHKDVVQSCSVGGMFLFSTSFDQTMSMFELDRLDKIKVNTEKLHMWKPKNAKTKELAKDDRYPWWQIAATEDGKTIVAGGRKISVFTFDGEKVGSGPSVTDTDTDHIECLRVKRNLILVCRKNTPRAKVFDLITGKESNKIQYKSNITKVDFLYGLQHAVVCCQVWEKDSLKPPIMYLWDLRK